jgi:hypothetical protein
MSIVHVGSSTLTTTATSGGTFAIPSSGVSGDLAEVLITSRGHNSGITLPTVTDTDSSGLTWILKGNTGSRKGSHYWKRLTNDSAGKVVTVAGCQNSAAAGIDVLRGVYLSGDPISNWSTRQIEASDPKTHSGFTPDHAQAMIRCAIVNHTNDLNVTGLTCTVPGSLEPEYFETLTTGGDDCALISTGGAQSGQSATGAIGWTQAGNQSHVIVWALRPEPSAATTPPSSTSQNPVHTYNSAGTYRVTLTVTDSLGRSATFSNSTVTVA